MQAFDKLVTDLLYTEYGPQLICLPREFEKKWNTLAKTQVAVIHATYDCLLWESCGISKKWQPAEVWSKLNPLIEAVDERNLALKGLMASMMATKRSEPTRSLWKVIRKGKAMTFVKNKRRFEALKGATNCYKCQVRLQAGHAALWQVCMYF